MIFLFVGEDKYSLKKEIKKLKEKLQQPIVENVNLDNFERFVNLVQMNSFFEAEKIFVADSLLAKISSKQLESLSGALAKKPQEYSVIFIEEKLPKKKIIASLPNVEIKKFDLLSERDIVASIKRIAKENDADISPLAAERIAAFVGNDLYRIEEEIKKLALYKKSDEISSEIGVGDVEELVKANFEAKIFDLIDAFAAKNAAKALKLINQFLESGENEIYILTMIARQLRNIAAVKFSNNVNERKLASSLKIHPYVAKKSIHQAKNFSQKEIIDIYNKIIEADFLLKSGGSPERVLQNIVI